MNTPLSIVIRARLVLVVLLSVSTSSQARIVDVTLSESGIEPDTVFIAPGDTVRWTVAAGIHQLHSDTDSFKSWDSGLLDSIGQTFELPFTYADGPGPFFYHDLGQGFHGAVVVSDTCWATGSFGESGPPTVADIVHVLRVLSGSVPAPDNIYRLDLNGDCVIDSADVRLISDFFQFGPGILPVYPVPTCCFPTVDLACPIVFTGDVNLSGDLTAADVIYVLGFVFRAFPGPEPCWAIMDVDCSGVVTAADVIYLVNHLFKSGPPPCDVCALIPGTWSCP
jgi:plastocyanin